MALDVKDSKILAQLDLNPRISSSKLAKKIRLSQQVTDYRIKKLKENKIINQFGTILNLSKIGYEQYRIFFELSSINEEEKDKLINYLREHNRVYWSTLVGGKWDLFVVVFTRNYEEFDQFLDTLFKKFSNTVRDYEALYTVHHEFYKHKYLHKEKKELPAIKLNLANPGKQLKPDKTDICILNQMKNNCRLSSLEISKKCNTSYKTVQNRIKKMEEEGLIEGYRLFLRSEEFNHKAYLLLISFKNYGRELEKKLVAYARTNKAVTQTWKLFGKWSLLFHIRIENNRALQKLVVEMKNKYPIIGNYEIIPLFEDIAIDNFPMSAELLKH